MRSIYVALMGRRSWMSGAIAVALAVAAAGCGGPRAPELGEFYPVKGKIIGPDGKPVTNAKVVFMGRHAAIVPLESDGTFTVKGEKDGLPAGEYEVRLEGSGNKAGTRKGTLAFPSRYLDADASGLKAKVTPEGPNNFEFKLTKDENMADATRGGH